MKFIAPMLLGILMGGIIIYFEPMGKKLSGHRKHHCRNNRRPR